MTLGDVEKQLIGRMISTSIEPFGYDKSKQIKLTKEYNDTSFVSASVYVLNHKPKLLIKSVIMEIEE